MAWEIEPGWILTAFGGLTTAIGTLWIDFRVRLSRCEKNHEESGKQNLTLTRELAEVKGELKGIKLFAAPELAKNVAKAVVEAMRNENS